jgi:CheY-like chemotaxis protein
MTQEGKGLVLVGEDDWAQAEVLLEVLSFEGYQVLAASNSQELLALLDKSPDILLLDMRGVSCPEIFEALVHVRPKPAVVIVSADSRVDAFAREVSADAYIRKPYELDDLIGTVGRLVEARRRDMRVSPR